MSDPRLDAVCPACECGFTKEQWLDRHSDGLDDVHAECCRVCKQESA